MPTPPLQSIDPAKPSALQHRLLDVSVSRARESSLTRAREASVRQIEEARIETHHSVSRTREASLTRAREASLRQIEEARIETHHQLPFTLQDIKEKWAGLERNVEALCASQLKGGSNHDVCSGAVVRVTLRELKRFEDQMSALLEKRQEQLQGEQAVLTNTLSRHNQGLQQRDAQVQLLQKELRQADESHKVLLASRTERTVEIRDETSTLRASAAGIAFEEAQAARRLARVEVELSAARAANPSGQAESPDTKSITVQEQEDLLRQTKAKNYGLFVVADAAGVELRAEMESIARLNEEVNQAHRSLAEAGSRSHKEQDDIVKLREELRAAEKTASNLQSTIQATAEELRAARKAAGLMADGAASPRDNILKNTCGESVPQGLVLLQVPQVEQTAAIMPSRTSRQISSCGDSKIEDLESSLLSIVRGNDVLEERVRTGKTDVLP